MYRSIDCDTWDDPWFSELNPDAKLLFLYLITNRRSTPCGAFEITLRAVSFETGIPRTQIDDLLKALASRVVWYPQHNAVWLRNFYKHQRCNDNYRKGAINSALQMPKEVQSAIFTTYPELLPEIILTPPPSKNAAIKPLVTVTKPLPNGYKPLPNPIQTGGKEEEYSIGENRIGEYKDDSLGKESAAVPPSEGAVKVFIDLFTEKIGQRPDIPPRFTKALKETQNRIGAERYRAAIQAFLSDSWASENGYSVETFVGRPADRWIHASPKATSRPSTPLVGGTLANAGHVQVKRPADWKPITLEEATRRDKEYAAQVAAKRESEKRQADALRNGS